MDITLLEFLRNPQSTSDFSIKDWETLVRQGRAANLLGRINYLLDKENLVQQTPQKALRHFQAAAMSGARQREHTLREVAEIYQIAAKKELCFTVLKGAAYVIMDLSCSHGRTFSDIDILVARPDVSSIEFGLLINGWTRVFVDDYDQRYYREWMHEIPPLRHKDRQTVIDLHHNILPPTNKDSPRPDKFCHQTVHRPEVGDIQVLASEDALIHSATHLFSESEYHNGLRDLSDIDLLLKHFSAQTPAFTSQLITRALTLGLAKYLYLALRYTRLVLHNQSGITSQQEHQINPNFSPLYLKLLDFCFLNIFLPDHSTSRSWRLPLAKFILHIRGHLIRMPLKMLIPHLLHKAFITPFHEWKRQRQLATEQKPITR